MRKQISGTRRRRYGLPLFWKIALPLICVPLLDLGSILLMSRYCGLVPTLTAVVVCGLVGAALLRREGLAAWDRVRRELALGIIPEVALLDGVIVLMSGVLLVTPGPLTDATGLILLLPPVRSALRGIVRRRVQQMIVERTASVFQQVVSKQ